MSISELNNKIKSEYINQNYERCLKYIEEYLTYPTAGIYDVLLNSYVKCLLEMGRIKEASKSLDILVRLYPNYLTPKLLVHYYIRCDNTTKLGEMLKTHSFSREQSLGIAKSCYRFRHYHIAEEMLNCVIDPNLEDEIDAEAKELLERLKTCKTFEQFKSEGHSLEPGHIVLIDELSNEYEENALNTDPRRRVRKYMIWRIEGEKIYAFPLSHKKLEKARYLLPKKRYKCLSADCVLKDHLAVFTEENILFVLDKVKTSDFRILIDCLYYTLCFTEQPRRDVKHFMDAQKSYVGIYDVITVVDLSTRTRKLYFVLGVDEENKQYKAIKVKTKDKIHYELADTELVDIDIDSYVLRVFHLTEEQTDGILGQVSLLDDTKKHMFPN